MICPRPMSVKFYDVSSEPVNNPDHQLLSLAEQGLALCAEKRWLDASRCFMVLTTQEPTNKIAWNNLGNVLDELGDPVAAIAAYQTALALDPTYQSPKTNLAIVAYQYGTAVYAEGRLDKAVQAFGLTVAQGFKAFNYDHSYLQLLLETCSHQGVAQHVAAMRAQTYADPKYRPHPYPLLASQDDPAWHLLAATRHLQRLYIDAGMASHQPAQMTDLPKLPPKPRSEGRIRIAYLSSDWHLNPVPQQLLPSIEAHDRTTFEVIGIATDTVPDVSPWRKRIERAFDRFYALGHLKDAEIAEQLRAINIDIAIDLSLYMLDGRPLILQSRPAGVQVALLGYAGTSGAPWIDYLIADAVAIPSSHAHFYSEKIIRLPGSFMPDNNERSVVYEPKNRPAALIQQGLPDSGFVFCAFNNPYKITPDVLACWFRLLHAVPKSVLWLQANNRWTQANLEAAAAAAGLDATRLVFAGRVDSFDDHLQRYAIADLFLDTFPYNAHVTAADSLWAGLPVLTLQGASFASRVASSILMALDLPELITTDMASYEARAIELATDALQLQNLRHKLARSKAEGRYFNQTQYVQALENALSVVAHPALQKLIAFSLWGDNSTYLIGALRNTELAAKLYPDWICRFYCASDLPQDFLNQLQAHPNVQVVLMPPKPDRGGAFWRFLAAEDAGVSHVLFRDADSRLSPREVAAVNEWLASDKDAHLMRDHPFHWPSIMAGMWGCKSGALLDWQAQLEAYQPTTEYGADQLFLADVIYPKIKERCIIHDVFGISEAGLDVRPFPTAREGLEFVGQCFDAHDIPNKDYEQTLILAPHL